MMHPAHPLSFALFVIAILFFAHAAINPASTEYPRRIAGGLLFQAAAFLFTAQGL